MTPRDRITLTGLEVFASHGVLATERRSGQRFVVDVVLELDARPATASDAVSDTVDYGVLAVRICEAVAAEPVNLIETVAQRVADVALAFEAVHRVQVTLHKPDAPVAIPFSDVAVTIERSRT